MNNSNETMLSLFVVDAFTDKPFHGNGAAVCLLPQNQKISDEIKQKIAAEMNRSETAFVSILDDGDSFDNAHRFGLRWFTPKCEVTLCGHATLASAAVLFFAYSNESPTLEFETVSGTLKATKCSENRIQIDLPTFKYALVLGRYEELIKAVVGSLPVKEVVLSESKKLLIRLEDIVNRKDLEAITTKDTELLFHAPDIAGVIVTLKGSSSNGCVDSRGEMYNYISRYFAPWMGISEDPVTGSAHSVLGPYWSNALGKKEQYTRQCSQRGGELHVKHVADRVLVSGDAVIVIKGKISF